MEYKRLKLTDRQYFFLLDQEIRLESFLYIIEGELGTECEIDNISSENPMKFMEKNNHCSTIRIADNKSWNLINKYEAVSSCGL